MISSFVDNHSKKIILLIFLVLTSANIIHSVYRATYLQFFHDDAFYYILPALNYLKYGFYAFDGINATNGFHPLLAWLETLVISFIGEDASRHTIYFTIVGFIATSIFGFAVGLAIFLYKEQEIYAYAFILSSTFLLSLLLQYYFNGMEAFLVLIFASMLVLSLLKNRLILASIAGVLTVMSRLDTVIYLLPPLYLSACYLILKKEGLVSAAKNCFFLFLPSVIFLIIYMLYNYYAFGYFKPISAVLKSTFPYLSSEAALEILISRQSLFASLCIMLAAILLTVNKNLKTQQKVIGIGLIISTIMYLFGFALFNNKWGIFSWYLAGPFFTSVTSLFLGIINIIDKNKVKIVSISLMMLIVILGISRQIYHYSIGSYNNYNLPSYEDNNNISYADPYNHIISFVKKLPKDSILAVTDSGALSFWSKKRIINLDGLINNFEYQLFLKDGKLEDYLTIKNVDYLITVVRIPPPEPRRPGYGYNQKKVFTGDYKYLSYFIYSDMYNKYSDKVKLYKCAEIYRNKSGFTNKLAFIMYDLKKNNLCSS